MKVLQALLILFTLVMPATATELIEVPHPMLDETKPDVSAMLAAARGRFELIALQAQDELLGIAYGRLGVNYHAHSEQDAARACFVNAMTLDPANYRWPYYLALTYTETGEFDKAIPAFERVLQLQPDYVPATTRLGLALLEADRSDDAEQHLRRALSADSASAAALAGLARIAEKRGDWNGAIDYYNKALGIQPAATELHSRLGQAYRRAGKVDQARTHLEQGGQRIAIISDPLLSLMEAHAKPAGYYVVVGNKALGEGELERASKLYDVAHAIDPTHAGAIVGLARIAYLAGQNEAAREYVDTAIRLKADLWSALQVKGLIEEQGGNNAVAIDFYQRSLAQQDFPQTRIFLADAQMRAGRFAQAAQNYGVIGESEAATAEILYRAGVAHVGAGQCSAAEPRFLAAYEKDPALAKVIQALARIYATCMDATDEQHAVAVRYAEVLYNGQPSLETSETLAMALAAVARYEDAVDYQTQAIFEALKTGVAESQPQLKDNMDRYREGQPARLPWPAGHAVFSLLAE